MVGIKTFKELNVYQLAFEQSLKIHTLADGFPKHEQFALTSQIRRSSKSICANIAEGFEKQRQSKAEFRRFLFMAVGSAAEVLVWLDYCLALKYISKNTYDELEVEYIRIKSMLNSFISKIE